MVACSVLFPWYAGAQIEISWSLLHNRTVQMEPVRATVKIANYSSQTLDLSSNGNAELSFNVEDQPTSFVRETGHRLVRRPIIIPPNDVREIDVNLLDAYQIYKGQSYMLTPVLTFEKYRFYGPRLSLEVQPGLELFSRDYGSRINRDIRRVSLRQLHRERSDYLLFRMDNPETGACLCVYDLGRLIRYVPPRVEQDASGVFHVLHQTAPDRFTHSMFDPTGAQVGTEFYLAETGAIRMERDDAGAITVAGGNRYEEDPNFPGMLVAPDLPPAHPDITIGELPQKTKKPAKERASKRKTK